MFRHILHTVTGYQQYLFVFVLTLFVLLSSCPVKAAIKNLSAEPITEQTSSGHHGTLSANFDRCADSELTVVVTNTSSSEMADLLPAVLLLSAAFLLFSFTLRKEQEHPLYRNTRIVGTLPLFLEYRQLII